MDRPTLGRVWAKDGKVTPFEDDKYEKGFVAEVPTYENLNYLQQKTRPIFKGTCRAWRI